jgi:hypothetical protein
MSEETNTAPAGVTDGQGGGSGDWLGVLEDDLKGLAEVKGWKEPGDALKSYRHLEEFMGADKAGRGVVLPRDNDDTAAFDAIYKAMGRPDEAAGYELGNLLQGEAVDENFMGLMSQAMHGAGLSKGQASAMAKAWQGHYNEVLAKAGADRNAAIEKVHGQFSPADLETARRGLDFAADGDQDLKTLIDTSLPPEVLARIFKKVGALAGLEDQGIEGATGSGANAPAAKIAAKKADPHFMQRYLGGEAAALAEMTELFRQAYGNK